MAAIDRLEVARDVSQDAEAQSVDDVLARVETMLHPSGGGSFAAAEHPLCASVRAAARFYGRKPEGPAFGAPIGAETAGDAIERMARSAGLIATQVALAPGWERRSAMPMIATRRSDGVPVALVPAGARWRVVPGDAAHRPRRLDAAALADLEDEAHALTPALPDDKIGPRLLLGYGLATKLRDLTSFSALTLVAGLALALAPIANLAVTEYVLPGRDGALLVHVAFMLVALVVASLTTRLAAELTMLRINGRTGLMLRIASADRMLRVLRAGSAPPIPPAAGALVARCLESWHRGVWSILLNLAAALLVALPSLVVMVSLAPLAGLGAIATILAATAFAALTAKRQVAHLFSGPASPTSWISLSYEALSQIEALRAHGAERRFFRLFSESFLSLKERFLATDRMGARIHALERALEALVIAVGIGLVVALHRDLPAQAGVAFTVALMTATGAAVALVHAFTDAAMLGLQHKMSQPLREAKPAPARLSGGEPMLRGAIAIEGAVVRRGKHARPILDGVSLSIAPGEHVAIVGPSGSGKSTLLRALMGLEPLEAGRVLFDGVPLDALDDAAVRRRIGVVGQSGQLFPGTIRDNVALGALVREEDVWEALRLAAIEDDVRALPLGLATPIGDAGSVFSGGQTQRILIARALALRPRIVILDEATSSLDPAVEARVAAALDALDATTISVAHRLDTIRRCDRIHVLEAGRIVESGTFDELLASGGAFARLVEAEARAGAPRNHTHDALQRLRAEFNPN